MSVTCFVILIEIITINNFCDITNKLYNQKMSARVFNPTVLSELYKLRSPAVTRRHIPNVAAIAKIKRDLFGPVDRDQAKR